MESKTLKDLFKRRTLLIFFLTFSLFLWLITFLTTDLGSPQPSALWYSSSLPIYFWLGISLSITTLLLSYYHSLPIKLICVLVPVLYLYTLPSYVHDLPPVYDIYHVIPIPINIIETGQLDLQEYSFPLSHIFWATNIDILKTEALSYARLFPTIFSSSIVITLLSISSKISKRWAFVAPLSFFSLYWYMESHMARQSYTLILWVLFILILLIFLKTKEIRTAGITILMVFCILTAHPGMTIFLFFNLVALSVISILFIKNKQVWNRLKFVNMITATAGIFFLIIYYSFTDVQELFQNLYDRMTGNTFETMDLGYRLKSSESYELANSLRAVKMLFLSFTALIASLTALIKRNPKIIALATVFLSCYLWLSYPLTHHGRYLERTFMAALIPSTLLITYILKINISKNKLLNSIPKVTITILLIALLLTIPLTKNSIDSFETPSREALQAGRFSQQHLEGRIYVTDTHEGLFRYLEATEESTVNFRSISGGSVEPTGDIKTGYQRPQTDRELDNHLFVDYFKNYFIVRFGNETIANDVDRYEEYYSNNHSKLYDSGGARLYYELEE